MEVIERNKRKNSSKVETTLKKQYSLDELVAKAKSQQSPAEIKTGTVGNEQF